ncbi:siroheme synthase CysG [Arenibaculum pallidiluteum]|uniref:siroheme synthase CysG n=1 Tax=Arenibaculum pallidiluteum TaxID=2812559 RepID=UPI001F3D3526|nr:siroheme synthase CysG [Arenibaculum pallidiluteum]
MPDIGLPPEPAQPGLPYLPLFLEAGGRTALVLGGGAAAVAKTALLRRAGMRVRVVAHTLEAELALLAMTGAVEHRARGFEEDDLDGAVLAVDASGDEALTPRVVAAARAARVPLNVVDRPAFCDFIFPAILDRSPVMVAISTGGLAPALARLIRQRLELAIPAAFGRLARLAGSMRGLVAARLPAGERRLRFWDAALAGPPAELVLAERDAEGRIAFERLLDAHAAGLDEPAPPVLLVGAGPGSPELLTVAAVRAIQGADVILHDDLVGPGILDLARRDARLIRVGKRAGQHSARQEEINALLLKHARTGARVVRLKGGDPFLFGRGGEEAEHLAAHGVAVRVIPGVTAALGCAASAGIPLTHRGVARALHLVTGHSRDGGLPGDIDWEALARAGGTIAVYMGREALPALAARLAEAGMPADTPAIAIENGTRLDERRCRAPLGELPDRVRAELPGRGPTLVIVGAVAALGGATVPMSVAAESLSATV